MNIKKFAAVILSVSFVALTACQQSPGKSTDKKASEKYNDGVYRVEFSPAIEDYSTYCVIEIKQNRIKLLELDALNADSEKKSANRAANDAMLSSCAENGFEPTDVARLYSDIINEFNKDGKISEKTALKSPLTSSLVKKAVNEVVEQAKAAEPSKSSKGSKSAAEAAKQTEAKTIELPVYYNGEYKATMPYYYNNYADFLTVNIENGKVTITQFDGINDKGELKTKDEKLKADMIAANKKSNLPETYPAKFTEDIKNMFSKNSGNTAKIDMISGATQSSNCFKKLLKDILYEAAYEDGNKQITSTPHIDGTYTARMSAFTNGYKEYLKISVKNGKVNIVEYDAVDEKGNLKSKDEKLSALMKSKKVNSPSSIFSSIIAEFKAKNDVSKMDNIVGATASSNNFKLMLGELLESNAKTGKDEVLEVNAENAPKK